MKIIEPRAELIEQLKDIKHDVVIAICSIDDLILETNSTTLSNNLAPKRMISYDT